MTDFITIAKERLKHETKLSELLKKQRKINNDIETEKACIKQLINDPESYFSAERIFNLLYKEINQIVKVL